MSTTQDLIRDMQENVAKYGRENTTTFLMVQAINSLKKLDTDLSQARSELEAVGAGGVQRLREPLEKVLTRREAVIKLMEQDCVEQALITSNLRGTRKVLWNLLGECLPLLHQIECNDPDSEHGLVSLISRIEDARTVVQAEELPGNGDARA